MGKRCIALGVCWMLVLASGCSSSGRIGEGERAIEGFSSLRASLARAQAEVDATLAAMEQVGAGGDTLSGAYKSFSGKVDDLQGAADRAADRARDMGERAERYIARWQEEMKTIQSETVRTSMEQRHEAVRTRFQNVRESAKAAGEAYRPFLSDLLDIRKALSIDLSPHALPGLAPVMDKARRDGETLKERIAALMGELDKIQEGLGAPVAAR